MKSGKNSCLLKFHSSMILPCSSCTVNLYEITDDAERISVAMELAKLSQNPQVIYQMKLSSSAINNCLIGLKSETTKADVQGSHALSTGYLDIWKATRNMEYYSIEFEQI